MDYGSFQLSLVHLQADLGLMEERAMALKIEAEHHEGEIQWDLQSLAGECRKAIDAIHDYVAEAE